MRLLTGIYGILYDIICNTPVHALPVFCVRQPISKERDREKGRIERREKQCTCTCIQLLYGVVLNLAKF